MPTNDGFLTHDEAVALAKKRWGPHGDAWIEVNRPFRGTRETMVNWCVGTRTSRIRKFLGFYLGFKYEVLEYKNGEPSKQIPSRGHGPGWENAFMEADRLEAHRKFQDDWKAARDAEKREYASRMREKFDLTANDCVECLGDGLAPAHGNCKECNGTGWVHD